MLNTYGNYTPQQLLYKIRCGNFNGLMLNYHEEIDNARISISIAKHCWAVD